MQVMEQGWKELGIKPGENKKGLKQQTGKVDLNKNEITIKAIIEEDADPIMKKMKQITKRFDDIYTSEEQVEEKPGLASNRNSPAKQRAKSKGPKKTDEDDFELEKTEESEKYAAFRNQRLMTPRMKKIMNKKDAACMLKDEIVESVLRLKAAKFGHSIEEIVPQY